MGLGHKHGSRLAVSACAGLFGYGPWGSLAAKAAGETHSFLILDSSYASMLRACVKRTAHARTLYSFWIPGCNSKANETHDWHRKTTASGVIRRQAVSRS